MNVLPTLPFRPLTPVGAAPDLVDQVYDQLVEAISVGTLASGARLMQEELAERLAVSRQPVLQALRLLKRDGLVSDAPGRGVVVTPLTPESLQWVYQLRSALDGLAASLAAHRVAIAETQETGTRTRAGASEAWAALVATGRQAIAAGDLSALIQADMAFHRAIYAAAGNPLIEASARPHWCHIRRAMGAVLGDREGVRRLRSSVWDEHEALADAIAQGDAPRAQHLAGDHGERAGQHLHQQLVRTLQSGGFHASQRRSA